MLLRRSWATRAVKLKSERRRAKRSPSFILVVGRSPDPAFGVVLRESGRYSPRGESRRSSTARSSRNAFSSDWRRQYSRAMRPWTPCRGNFLAPCIPEGASDGKRAPPWQDMRAMYPKSPANRLSGMHSAQILPGRGPFRCTDPSNHTWRANLAIPPTVPNRPNARNPCATAPSGHSGHRQQHQRRHPRHHRFAGSPRCLRLIDRLPSPSAVPRSHPLQLRLPWRSAFPTCGVSLRLYFVRSAAAIGV